MFFLPPLFSLIVEQSPDVLHSNLPQYHRYYPLHHLFLPQLSQHQFVLSLIHCYILLSTKFILGFTFYLLFHCFQFKFWLPAILSNCSCLDTHPLLCWFKHSPFSSFSKQSLSVSPNRFSFLIKRLTSVKVFHHYFVYFLFSLHSSYRRMTTVFPLLCWGTPARLRTFTWYPSSIHIIVLKNLIRCFYSFEVLVNFRLHKHWYFFRDTISRKTATQSWRVYSTHETDYSPPDVNPVFYGLGELLLLSLLLSNYLQLKRRGPYSFRQEKLIEVNQKWKKHISV